ncbi:MAG TPA: hypothetical protein G4N91_05715 [Dehalococcoidia bacterium]|nr:hypothetical protein [Dehalococcoidia bacterium]
MLILRRVLVLSLALVLSLTFVGCEGLPQGEIDQIIAGATASQFDTVSFDMRMPMEVSVTGESSTVTTSISLDINNGVMDVANEEMYYAMAIMMEMPLMGEQEVTGDVYLVDGWMYTRMEFFGLGEQWVKTEVNEETWQQQDPLSGQLEFLAAAVEVNYLRTETVDGVECYLFEIVPDMEALGELLSEETAGMGMIDFSQFDLAELCTDLSVREWIAVDSSLIMKVEIYLALEMSASEAGVSEEGIDSVTTEVTMVVNFHDYDEPVFIELPPEALEAEELPD